MIAATAFFVAAEFAFVASDRTRIEAEAAEGRRRSQAVLRMLETLSFQLSGAQLGITIAAVVLGFIAEPVAASLLEPLMESIVGESASRGASIVVALVLATVFTMVVGELVPKNVAIARPESTAKLLATPFRIYSFIAGPFIRVSDGAAAWLTRKMGVEPQHELRPGLELDDLEYLVRSSGDEGTLASAEVNLLTRSLRFADKSADDVMIPRIDVYTLPATSTVAELVAISADTGLSRFPIVRGDLDHVVGVVHVKAALAIEPDQRETTPVTEVMRDVLAVPETRDLHSILVDMRGDRLPLAVVVDEHGGTAGMLTLEDLLEEIVGEIDDEHDDATERTAVEDEGIYAVSGSLHRDEVREACGFEFPDGDYETIAGFVLDQLQRIPVQGEIVRHDGWRLEVVEMDRRRIATLRLHEPWAAVQARLRSPGGGR